MPITERVAARRLTSGERRLAASMFGDGLDADEVLIHASRWWPFQPRHIVMAPDGHIWCHPRGTGWRADWSCESLQAQAFFLHELTHVWQWQQGICVFLCRPPFARYRYRLIPGKPFLSYGLEQQAEIVRHAHLARGTGGDAALEAVLPFRFRPAPR